MSHELSLALALSERETKIERTLQSFLKTASAPPPKPVLAPRPAQPPQISKMKQAVKSMSETVKAVKASEKAKLSSTNVVAIADAWGRQLAHEDFEKGANVFQDIGRAAKASSRFAWAANQAKAGLEAAKRSGPGARAVAGGLAGGYLANKSAPDEQYVDRHGNVKTKGKKLRTVAGAALGAAAGAATHPAGRAYMKSKAQRGYQYAHAKATGVADLLKRKEKKAGVELMRAEMEKMSLALNLGAMATRVGGAVARGINRVGPAAGRALGALKATGAADPLKRGLVGAGVGAGVGAVRHAMKPKDPQTGRRQGSLMGSMLGHSALGAGAGLAAPHLAGMALETKPVQQAMQGNFSFRRQRPTAAAGPASQATVPVS